MFAPVPDVPAAVLVVVVATVIPVVALLLANPDAPCVSFVGNPPPEKPPADPS